MGIVVYQQTGSALIVAMVTMLRLVPMGLFGAFLGAFAERFDRRLTLAGVVGLLAITLGRSPSSPSSGTLEVWHLAVASFINGCGWATDNPLRRVMMGEVMGRDRMATAMALDVGAGNVSRMVGPTVGGLLLASVGIEGAFLLSVAAVCDRHRGDADGPEPHSILTRIGCRAGPHLGGRGAHLFRPAPRRDHGGHRHLQRLRLALHQHDPRDRHRPARARSRRRRPPHQRRRRRRFRRLRAVGAVADAGLARPRLCRRHGRLPGRADRLCACADAGTGRALRSW